MRNLSILLACSSLTALSGCVVVTDFGRYSAGEGRDGGEDLGDGGEPADARVPPGDGSVSRPDASDGGADPGCAPACSEGETCADGVCRCGEGDACATGSACCAGACVDLDADLDHCGACERACESAPNATRACTDGACEVSCEDGFADCDAAPGCEASLSSIASCGGCGTACATGERCASVGGAWACAATCPPGTVDCGGSCVDADRDVSHCGGCGMVCPSLPSTARTCAAGDCAYACEGAYVDCDGDLATPASSNGCEVIPPLHYRDADGDGVGAGTGMRHCTGAAPSGWVRATGDCDDTSATRFPGQLEACNGADEDCDGRTDEGYTWMGLDLGALCSCESGARTGAVTCTTATMASCAYPVEACNGVDDDCDGTDDDGFACAAGTTGTCTVALGGCSAVGTRRCDAVTCTWDACELPAETCDGVDEDCDGFVDDGALGLGATTTLVASGFVVAEGAWHPGSGMGGAIAYMTESSGLRRVYWQRIDVAGAPLGSPVRVAEAPDLSFPLAIGWDGSQWAIFYSAPSAPGSPTYEVSVVRVTTSGSAGAATYVSVGQEVFAASNGSAIGVALRTGGASISAGVYANGAWTRALAPLLTLPSGSFDSPYPIVTAGSGFVVVALATATGVVHYRRFDATTTQTARQILTDATLEYPLHAAVDASGTRLAVGWQVGAMPGGVGLFDLATGAVVRTHSLGALANEVYPVAWESGFLVASATGARRMRIDGELFPESYPGFTVFREVFATPGGRWGALRIASTSAGTSTFTQGIGCP